MFISTKNVLKREEKKVGVQVEKAPKFEFLFKNEIVTSLIRIRFYILFQDAHIRQREILVLWIKVLLLQ